MSAQVTLTEAEREAVCRSSANHAKTVAAVERIVAARMAQALREAADDPALRLSGHSGISVTRLRDRAEQIEKGETRG